MSSLLRLLLVACCAAAVLLSVAASSERHLHRALHPGAKHTSNKHSSTHHKAKAPATLPPGSCPHLPPFPTVGPTGGNPAGVPAFNYDDIDVEIDKEASIWFTTRGTTDKITSIAAREGDWVTVNFINPQYTADTQLLLWTEDAVQAGYEGFTPARHIGAGHAHGAKDLFLDNLHQNVYVTLASGAPAKPVIRAVSAPLSFAISGPLQVRLAKTAVDTEMQVHWIQADNSGGSVAYGLTEKLEMGTVHSTPARTYGKSDMQPCVNKAGYSRATTQFYNPGYFQYAELSKLEAGKKYYYQVASHGSKGSNSSILSFTVASASSAELIVYGDAGLSWTDTWGSFDRASRTEGGNLYERVFKDADASTAILHIGDINYSEGNSWMWDQWGSLIEDLTSAHPYMACEGNHERAGPLSFWSGQDSGGECGIPFRARFHFGLIADEMSLPDKQTQVYSFNQGPMHVIVLNTDDQFDYGTPQWKFVYNDLMKVNRKVTPFVIVTGHRPMCGYSGCQSRLKYALEPLMAAAQVDLAIWGHVHAYVLTYPVLHSKKDPNGIVHITVGTAGIGLSTESTGDNSTMSDIVQPGKWSVAHYGFTRLRATQHSMSVAFVDSDSGSDTAVHAPFTMKAKKLPSQKQIAADIKAAAESCIAKKAPKWPPRTELNH